MKVAIGLALVLFVAGCARGADTAVIVAGSTSVQPYAELLAEEYLALRPGEAREIDVLGGGSSAGIRAAESGTADIGMSSRGLSESESGLWQAEIAKDGLAVIVHPENPLRDLGLDALRAVYTGETTHWRALGGADHKIHVVAREEGSGTRAAFDELVMAGARVSPRAIVQDSNGSVRQLVSQDPYAVGFVSLGTVDETVAAVAIDGIAADRVNIENGGYVLYRPFLFVAPAPPEGEAKDFVDFALSEAGRLILQREGLIPPGGLQE